MLTTLLLVYLSLPVVVVLVLAFVVAYLWTSHHIREGLWWRKWRFAQRRHST